MDGHLLHSLCPCRCFFCSLVCRDLTHWKLVLEVEVEVVGVVKVLVLEVVIALFILVVSSHRIAFHSHSHPSALYIPHL